MIEVLPESQANVLVLRARNKLTHADYEGVLIPQVETIVREHGKVRVLVDLGDAFQGWELAALWDDARFGLAHWNDFEKMGIVGGPRWYDRVLKALEWVMGGEIRAFPPNERAQALEWLNSPPSPRRESAAASLLGRIRRDRAWQRRLAIVGSVTALLLVVMATRRAYSPRRR